MEDPKTLKEWFEINPNHECTLRPHPDGRVRAVLGNGEGIDKRIVGDGDNETLAIAHALEVREAIRRELP